MTIYKRDAFSMTPEQVAAGREMWRTSGQQGRLVQSSLSAEDRAPKTWIFWVNAPSPSYDTLECELYTVPRATDPNQLVLMLIGMCPRCGNNFSVREDNKQMHVDAVLYRDASRFLRMHFAKRIREVEGRDPRDDDRIPVVSSPERWQCDYCLEWCVCVEKSVAKNDYKGGRRIVIDKPAHIFGSSSAKKDIDF